MRKVLVFCDDTWHPAETVQAGLAPLEGAEFEFTFHRQVGKGTTGQITAYPLVILAKSNNASSTDPAPWMTGEVQAEFVEYVRQGGGLLAIHSGTAGYTKTADLRALLGGVFSHHPEQCPVTVTPHPGHLLTGTGQSFTENDEHYFMTLDDPQADVFLTTTSQHGDQPGGWTRSEGRGRVCVLTPGHTLPVWLHPSYQSLIRAALLWCGRASETE